MSNTIAKTVKDIYLVAHEAAVKIEDATPRQLAKASQDAFEASKLAESDWEAFDAHFQDTFRRVSHLQTLLAPSEIAAAIEKRKAESAPAPAPAPATQPA